MSEKRYFIPAFFVITADSLESADKIAVYAHDALNDGSYGEFYLDEGIPTVEVPFDVEFYSILDIIHITPMSKEEIDDIHQL